MQASKKLIERAGVALLLVIGVSSAIAGQPATNLVIQASDIDAACAALRCTSQKALGDPQGQFFAVATPLKNINYAGLPGVIGAETDQVARAMDAVYQGFVPAALYDATPVSYFGTTVRSGYMSISSLHRH